MFLLGDTILHQKLKTNNNIIILMAVPKKRTSKSKKNSRKANWKRQANVQARQAFSLAQSVLTGKSKSFIYNSQIDDE